MSSASLTILKRRKGTVKASITRLSTRLTELEDKALEPWIFNHAQRMLRKLETLDAEFKAHHLSVIDATENEEQLAEEQELLDTHDDAIAELSSRLETMLNSPIAPAASETRSDSGVSSRVITELRLSQLQTRLTTVNEAVMKLTTDARDVHLVYLYQEQLSDFKKELSDIRNEAITQSLMIEESDPLNVTIQRQEREIFDMSLEVKRILYNPDHVPESLTPLTPEPRGVKLPKIDVPTFDGDILHWQSFWEQFCIAIHDRTDISDTEKLVYLRHSLKDGSAKSINEGLSHSGDQYTEAVASLKSRYNRPRLIHQTHVRKIYEVPGLKEGTGKELRRLHDTVQQHLRALKAMGHDPSGPFITSLLELKLDSTTMFEWQKASQDSSEVPHYKKLLECLNLQAQASDTCTTEKKHPWYDPRRQAANSRQVTAFATSASEPSTSCPLCNAEKHPLYTCPRFKLLPQDKKFSTIRENKLCLNCLKPGHLSKNCNISTAAGSAKGHITPYYIMKSRKPSKLKTLLLWNHPMSRRYYL